MSNLDISEKRLPQGGVFRINFYERGKANRIEIDCRATTCRAIVGENVTIRILDPRQAQLGLEELNHSHHVLEPLKMFLKSSTGMILVTGPTGSGRSSTLYGAMRYLYDPGIKIITAEDPIEFSFPGIMQTQIQPKINLTFSRLLRSFLRLDPDVILVGELRDEETAKIAFDAAQTGHVILSTLHTNDSISSVSRLLDLSIDYSQMASSLRCVLAQRLVRRICTSCVQEQAPGEDEWGLLFRKYPTHLRFYKGQGCESCNFTGYKGRTVLSEVFIVDGQIARAMNRGLDEDGLRKLALEGGMKSMLEDGLLKLQETTLSEITRVIPHAMTKAFRLRNHAQQAADFPIDVDKRHAASQKREDSAPSSFDILDPRADGALINRMLERYQGLLAMNSGNSSTVDAAHFNEFITSNYDQICEKYGCRRVTFSIANNQGKVEILAIPNP
jgi:type IV pilus assembly protein PilB